MYLTQVIVSDPAELGCHLFSSVPKGSEALHLTTEDKEALSKPSDEHGHKEDSSKTVDDTTKPDKEAQNKGIALKDRASEVTENHSNEIGTK